MKHGFKKVGILIAVCTLSLAFSQKPRSAVEKKNRDSHKIADSLKVLNVILRSEFAEKSQVYICKNPSFADSLVRSLCSPETFRTALSDSSVLEEIKSREQFKRYWQKVEVENGIPALKGQMQAHDVDKTLIPKAYALDSSVVIYPGYIIIRKK